MRPRRNPGRRRAARAATRGQRPTGRQRRGRAELSGRARQRVHQGMCQARTPNAGVIPGLHRSFVRMWDGAVRRRTAHPVHFAQIKPLLLTAVREETTPAAYATFAHTPTGRGQMTLLVRTSRDPQALIPILWRLAREMDPLMPLASVELLSQRVAATT